MERKTLLKGLASGLALSGANAFPSAYDVACAQETSFTIGSVLDPLVSTPFLVAQEKGFFKKHNVAASVKTFSSGAVITQAITGKSLDLGATGGVPATFLAGHQIGIRVIARICEVSWAYALMAMPGSKILKPQDIVGKTVSMTYGTVSQYLVLAFAEHWNIPANSFKMVNLNGADQVNALVTGKVDMASLWTPFTTKAQESGAVVLETARKSNFAGLTGDVKLVGDPGVLFATNEFLAKNGDATVRLLQALYEGFQFTLNHREEAAAIVASTLNVTPRSIAEDFERAQWSMHFDPDLVDELDNEWKFLKKQGFITGDYVEKAWIDPTFMRRAVPSMVSVK